MSANNRLMKFRSVKPLEMTKSLEAQSREINDELQEKQEYICICERESDTLYCRRCKMFTYGRVKRSCIMHPNVTFLMDFSCCPYCLGHFGYLHSVNE